MKFKGLAKRLSASFMVLVLMAGVGELAVRLLTDTEHPVIMRDPVIGRRFLPSFEGLVYDSEADRRVPLHFNSLGFRGPEWKTAATPDVRRVALLGDSMIASVAMEEHATLGAQLESMLQTSHPDVSWEVLNCGIPGSSTAQELVCYRKLIRNFEPDLVLCGYFFGNDLGDNSQRLTNNPRIYFELDEQGQLVRQPFNVQRSSASRWLNLHSRLYVWQKSLGAHLVHAASFAPSNWIHCTDPTEDVVSAWKLSGALLAQLGREVTADGHQFAVVGVPCHMQIYRDRFQSGVLDLHGSQRPFDWNYADRRLGELCASEQLPYVSLVPPLRAAAPEANSKGADELLFYRGAGHWNEHGTQTGARALHAYLTQVTSGTSVVDSIDAR